MQEGPCTCLEVDREVRIESYEAYRTRFHRKHYFTGWLDGFRIAHMTLVGAAVLSCVPAAALAELSERDVHC